MEPSTKTKKTRKPNFKIELPGDDADKADIYEKMQKVKAMLTTKLNRPVNNKDIFENLLEHWIRTNTKEDLKT